LKAIVLPYQHHMPNLHRSIFLAPTAQIIGRVTLGAHVNVWFSTVIRGDVNWIEIGDRTNVQDGTVIHVGHDDAPTQIGKDVTIGHSAIIHGCCLEDHSFVGMGAIVLDKAHVESGAMVAAGALIPAGKRIPSGEIWAGRPARFMRLVSEKEKIDWKLGVERYCQLAQIYAVSP
jgi:carbonic anhydrase/acetyltransferase-like protein (isoleucine patch superfamily)